MKVSVLTPDLSHNCLGRAHLLAQLLERNYEVEIIGPQFQDDIWAPVRDDYEYREVDSGQWIHEFAPDIPELNDLIDGDVVLVSKPRVPSYGIALLNRISEDRPLVLDIDDWETGFKLERGKLFTLAFGVPSLVHVTSFYYTRALEALSGLADARTVSNRFLQKKFGGELIPHARDTEIFDPERFNKMEARRKVDLPTDKQLVMFSGTPRSHKGVEELVRSVTMLDREDIRLVIVGADESEYVKRLRKLGGKSLILRGQQPFEEIPRWIAAADVIAIPQRRGPGTKGQLPAKVFDAMAMAKPIIATNAGDLPEVLNNCGYLVESASEHLLKKGINELLESKSLRQSLGARARSRCLQRYSHDVVAPHLSKVIESATKTS